MMKKSFIFLLILTTFSLYLFVSCNSSNSNKSADNEENIAPELQKKAPARLVVESDGVPVYLSPSVSNPEFVLNTRAECKIIERGSFATIMGIEDFWYHIDYNGKQGWIFGEFTSVRQSSEFDVFLREFGKEVPDTLSRRFSIAFLNGKPGFKPLNYKRLDGTHYAALFYNNFLHPVVEMLIMIYESGKPIKEFTIYKGDISNCHSPHAYFISQNFIKFIGPSCNKDISPITYFFIQQNFDIEEVKSSVITKTSADLIPAIKSELAVLDASISDDCKCTVHSTIKEAYSSKQFIFYTIVRDQCTSKCNSNNSTLIAMPDSAGWMVKFEEPGGFKAIYESGIEGKYIVVLEEVTKQQIVQKSLIEKLYLFTPAGQTLKELNVDARSCIIMAPAQYGCDYCKKSTTHIEELIIKGNPVKGIIKKISNLYYDNSSACILTKQDSYSINYQWVPEKAAFELVAD